MWKLFFLSILMASIANARDGEESIALSIGRSATWTVDRADAITVSNGAVVRVVDKGSTIKITGVKLGHAVVKTTTDARPRSLEISVLPEASYRSYERLAGAIEGRRGLTIDVRSGSLEVRGRLLRAKDWVELAAAMRSANDTSYRFAASIDEHVKKQVVLELGEVSRRASLPEPDFRFDPMATALVPAEPKELQERYSRLFAAYGIRTEPSSAIVALAPMVRVKIVVAEVKKTHASQIGVSWPASASGQLLPSPRLPSDGTLDIALRALEQRGLGKILASPTLLCRSGKEAEFLAGGEFPIKIAGFKSQDVTWKKYGVLLKIKPQADLSGRMSIALVSEVSMIDSAHSIDGVPGLLSNRIETHFDLSGSRTIALSGLIKKEWGESVAGLPGLSRLPVLGPLFGSRDYQEQESELVIFVTPELQRHESVN